MEEEINYSTVVFKDKAPEEKKEDSTIYAEVKPKGAATTVPNGEAAGCSRFRVLACVGVGILCVLLVASIGSIIYLDMELNEQRANHDDITAEKDKLIMEKSLLEREMTNLSIVAENLSIVAENLSIVAENLNRTLEIILTFDTFPVNEYCPEKKCQPCPKSWILFKEKCYLFYEENAPWKTREESRGFCQKKKADLVVVDNLQEQEFISSHTKYYHDSFHGYWIGLKKTKDNYWVWVDGRKDTLGYWINNGAGPYALFIPGRNLTASWGPANRLFENKFICENDPIIWST
ncbi:C-type lectin domain family 12 member B-like [Sebastes umbrosus]|uniref:C-type lectin domain family 12 member B-like n=1 Tax=Sebastes umbrosus TaxID=72105 RepID=UPI00189EB2D9|nr:C-type lectin domain family 12 member B-like [Sebastes umbrosus]